MQKYVSLNNQQCMTQPTLNNLHRNKFSQGLRHYPFAVNLDVLIYLIERMCSKENKI